MSELITDLAVPPRPFVHFLVTRPHIWRHQTRFSCLCGFRSGWLPDGERPDHPHRQVTVSRLDLTVIPHPSGRAL